LSLRLAADAAANAAETSEPASDPAAERETTTTAEPEQDRQDTAAVVEEKPGPTQAQPRFTNELRSLSRAFADGEFEAARELLDVLRDRVSNEGTDAERAELWRLTAFLHIAFNEQDRACEAYRILSSLPDAHELDPDLVSPKIRQVLGLCKVESPG